MKIIKINYNENYTNGLYRLNNFVDRLLYYNKWKKTVWIFHNDISITDSIHTLP